MMNMNATPANHINTTDIFVDTHAEPVKALHTMALFVHCLAFILGVLGNGVVIWVTGFKMKKTVNTVWFLNLAVADFLFTAFLPLSVTYLISGFHWPFGKFMCKLNSTLSSLNVFVSVYILVVISVDRCVFVVWPVWAQNHRSVNKASFVSLGVWVLALIFSTPYLIFRDLGPSRKDNHINCIYDFVLIDDLDKFRYQAMIITNFLLGFVIPFFVIVSCYAVIIHHVRINSTLSGKSGNTFRIIAAVIITFFLCWAPFHIMALIELVNHSLIKPNDTLTHVTTIGTPIATSLAFINSCLNPLLYVFMVQDFKHNIHKSITRVLETAFQEVSFNSKKSSANSQSKGPSV